MLPEDIAAAVPPLPANTRKKSKVLFYTPFLLIMHKLVVIGHLGADAQVITHNSSQFLTFRVAHSDRYKVDGQERVETIWYDCTYARVDAPVVKWLKAGQMVYVTGRPSYRIFDSAKYHQKMVGVSLFVNEIQLCGARRDSSAPAAGSMSSQGNSQSDSEVVPF